MDKNNVIVDLDGTLCDVSHRLPLIRGRRPQWQRFFMACELDPPKQDVINVVKTLAYFYDIHIFSGRGEIARELTEQWLEQHEIQYESLSMRPMSTRKADHLLKRDWVMDKGFTPENVLCILDDRQSVVDMWREMGFTCLQVAPGDF